MANITVRTSVTLDAPMLVEGLPGVGLVGKLATDHLVDQLEMTHVASVGCAGLPRVAVYREDRRTLQPPVRLYADEEHDLLALQSDVPVSPSSATEFVGCLTDWIADRDATPLYLSGLASQHETDEPPAVFGAATGDGGQLLEEVGLDLPPESGVVSGPTGALLDEAGRRDLAALSLVVESDPRFPDPEAARQLLVEAIQPLTGVEVDTDTLIEQAEQIQDQKEQLAARMRQAEDESSRAQPLRMFQ